MQKAQHKSQGVQNECTINGPRMFRYKSMKVFYLCLPYRYHIWVYDLFGGDCNLMQQFK